MPAAGPVATTPAAPPSPRRERGNLDRNRERKLTNEVSRCEQRLEAVTAELVMGRASVTEYQLDRTVGGTADEQGSA